MKRIYFLIAVSLISTCIASATDWSTMEGYLGYDFVRFNPNSGYVPSFNANGGSGQFAYNINKWIGGVVEVGAVNKGTLNQSPVDTTVLDFVAGPRITFHNHSRFTPFAEVLFGGAYATTSTPITVPSQATQLPARTVINPNLPVQARLTASNTDFAMMAGGGLDIKVSKSIAFRPFEADYYLTRVSSLVSGNTTNRNNFRYSAGINFLFGKK